MGVSNTDFVNSGSYFFTDRVVIFGITTLTGFGGSFFNIGLIIGLTDTKDFACDSCFLTAAFSFASGLLILGSGFFEIIFTAGFFTACFLMAGFFVTPPLVGRAAFLGADFAGFPPAGRAGLAIAFFTNVFFAGLTAFLVAGFPLFGRAGFLVGMLF